MTLNRKMTMLTKDGIELAVATQRAREKLGELDVTVSITGFIDLCQLALKGLALPEERPIKAPLIEMIETASDDRNSNEFVGIVFRSHLSELKALLKVSEPQNWKS